MFSMTSHVTICEIHMDQLTQKAEASCKHGGTIIWGEAAICGRVITL